MTFSNFLQTFTFFSHTHRKDFKVSSTDPLKGSLFFVVQSTQTKRTLSCQYFLNFHAGHNITTKPVKFKQVLSFVTFVSLSYVIVFICLLDGDTERLGVNFTNILWAALTRADPKSVKKTVKLSSFFALLGSVSLKAARRTLVKLTRGWCSPGKFLQCLS